MNILYDILVRGWGVMAYMNELQKINEISMFVCSSIAGYTNFFGKIVLTPRFLQYGTFLLLRCSLCRICMRLFTLYCEVMMGCVQNYYNSTYSVLNVCSACVSCV